MCVCGLEMFLKALAFSLPLSLPLIYGMYNDHSNFRECLTMLWVSLWTAAVLSKPQS